MQAPQRFCEECGAPLTADAKFCEDCGRPVNTEGFPGDSGGAGTAPLPLAVIPFAYRQRGVFAVDRCNIVVYPDQVVLAFVPPDREKENDAAMTAVQAALAEKRIEGKTFWQLAAGAGFALFNLSWSPVSYHTADAVREKKLLGNISVKDRPWERYLAMSPDAVLFEDKRNVALPHNTIAYIRGESDPSTSTDQIHIRSSSGLTRLFFDLGTYLLARSVLFSFHLPGPEGERSIGVIPSAGEPEVKGFGFQYTWTLVVTDRRILFYMDTDDFVDEMQDWLEIKRTEAKKAGRKLREGELAGHPDAPWQKLAQEPVKSLLSESDVNFFVPLDAIRSVRILPGDTIRFDLPGEPYEIVFAEGSTDHIRKVLGQVLGGRLS